MLQYFTIEGAPIKQVKSTKSLGLHIDEHLSWSVHVDAISKKIASGIGALKRIRPFVPRTTLHAIFHSLIQHILTIAVLCGGIVIKLLLQKCRSYKTVWLGF